MKLCIICILLVINLVLLWFTQEPKNLVELKQKYQTLLEYINEHKEEVPKKFHVLGDRAVVVGQKRTRDLGYNMNKGLEIGICLDGTVNDMFHVLLHELSHSTVSEYSHSEEFWKNFGELKDMCVRLGIYEKITGKREFCGKFIQD